MGNKAKYRVGDTVFGPLKGYMARRSQIDLPGIVEGRKEKSSGFVYRVRQSAYGNEKFAESELSPSDQQLHKDSFRVQEGQVINPQRMVNYAYTLGSGRVAGIAHYPFEVRLLRQNCDHKKFLPKHLKKLGFEPESLDSNFLVVKTRERSFKGFDFSHYEVTVKPMIGDDPNKFGEGSLGFIQGEYYPISILKEFEKKVTVSWVRKD